MGNRVFGCDDCLAVCPWELASASADLKLAAQDGRALPSLAGMLSLDEAGFRQYFFRLSCETYRLYPVSAQLSDRGRKCR